MALEELLQIIKNKRESAENELVGNIKSGVIVIEIQQQLLTTIDTYTDLICLIESELKKEKE